MLPSLNGPLSMEAFSAMKRRDALEYHRDGLDSRSSEPPPRSASNRQGGGRSKRRNGGSEHASGVTSAPASRGDVTSEPLTPTTQSDMPLLELPQSEPARGRMCRSPPMQAGACSPPVRSGFAGMLHTPERAFSTPTLHGNGTGGKPPAVPKRRSLGSRERAPSDIDSSVMSLSPLLDDEGPHTSAPSRARVKASISSPQAPPSSERERGGELASPPYGYPGSQSVPTLPMGRMLGVTPSAWSSRDSARSSARSVESSSLQIVEELPARRHTPPLKAGHGGSPPLPRRIAAAVGPAVGDPHGSGGCRKSSLCVPQQKDARRRHNSAAPDVGANAGCSSPEDKERRRKHGHVPSLTPERRRSSGGNREAAAPVAPSPVPTPPVAQSAAAQPVPCSLDAVRPTNDLLDIASDVVQQSYGWDEHDDSGEGQDSAGSLPGKGKLPASLSCIKGPNGVKALSMSASGADVRAEMRAAALQMTLNAPDSVKGTNLTWVKGEILGQGSLGSVFKALDQRTGQIFAVKEVRIDVRDKADVKFRAALENEIDICKDLKHDRIVSYLGHDNIDSSLYIYLEYMPGGSLTQVLSQFGPFEEALIATYTRDLLQGLNYLHTRDPVVLHRDVKGANILVGLDCRVKLSDFGCSKRTADTLSLSLRGSIPWMAPEVIQQTGGGRRSDIWSLGCVVIEMATARHPWGEFDNPVAAMVKIGMSNATPPLPEAVSACCKDFIKQCTQRDKNQRPCAEVMLEHELVKDLCDPD